jgi:hypothetical protein
MIIIIYIYILMLTQLPLFEKYDSARYSTVTVFGAFVSLLLRLHCWLWGACHISSYLGACQYNNC